MATAIALTIPSPGALPEGRPSFLLMGGGAFGELNVEIHGRGWEPDDTADLATIVCGLGSGPSGRLGYTFKATLHSRPRGGWNVVAVLADANGNPVGEWAAVTDSLFRTTAMKTTLGVGVLTMAPDLRTSSREDFESLRQHVDQLTLAVHELRTIAAAGADARQAA